MRVDSLEKIIFQTIKEIDTIEKYEKFLEFYGHGNIYCFSPENAIAIFAQNSNATLVGTYDMWKRYGRYPLKNVGIAVYPYNTSGVFGKFADYLYDMKDTKNTTEKEISVWKLSEEQKNEYFQWKQEIFYREEAKDFFEYLSLQFYEDVKDSLDGEHSDLLYGNQKVAQTVMTLLCESITKVYMTRCGVSYQMSEEADKCFHKLLSDDSITKSMFLMKCIKVVQEIAHKEIQQVNYYFRKEREMRNNGRESKQTITNSSGVRGNIENTAAVGETDHEISHGKISGTNSDSVSEPRNGEALRSESKRGEGILPEYVSEDAGERAGLEDGSNGKDTTGESDSTADPKQNRAGDPIPANHVLEEQRETQLNMFAYMNAVTDNNIATSNITPDGLSMEQLEQMYIQPLNELIDTILLAGVGGYKLEARYNIFNYYSAKWEEVQRKNKQYVATAQRFIEKQYLGASLGFVINERKISVYYDNDGMKLAYGEEARLHPQLIVSWNDVEERIFSMIAENRFIDSAGAEMAKVCDVNTLITDIIYYIRDGFQGVDTSTLPKPFNESNVFPDLEEKVRDLLNSRDRSIQLLEVMKKMWKDCEKGILNPAWKYAHDYQRVEHLENYLRGSKIFNLPEYLEIPKVNFIPVDAFDRYVGITAKGVNAVKRKYEYFYNAERGNNVSGLIKYLKDQFGMSGSGYRGFQRNHTSKGFQIEIAKEYSNPFRDGVVKSISDREMAKRVCNIMKSGQFFTKKEYDNYFEWERKTDEYNAAVKAFEDNLEKERAEYAKGRKGDMVYPEYISKDERNRLVLAIVKNLIQDNHFERGWKLICAHLERMKLSGNDLVKEEFEELVYETFQDYKDEIFYLQKADFAKLGINHGLKSRFRECLECRCFPGNYIDADGWLGSTNYLTISFEQITEGIIYHRNRDLKEIQYSPNSDSTINPFPAAVTEMSKDTGKDFYYSDDWKPNNGSDAERYLQNIEAIKMLKKLEQEESQADYEEQIILSKYVGWGGLSKYFDGNAKSVWKQYEELKNLLTEEEYKSAKATVTDSFYTPREVLEGIYQALERFGFKGGNVLEPAMGIGNFFSAMPKEMKENSTLNGIEIDSISGRIAKFLHPNCNIQISGIENAQLQEDYYDVVIGNVPFGDYKVNDKKYNRENFLIHDYFFAKAIEHCAPGGIICFVTSKGTLDKKNPSVRKYISERAEFVGAIRLPNTTFRDSANTEATRDLIFLRKKESASIISQEFEFVEQNEEGIQINSYYISHPDMMLGRMKLDTKRFGESRAISYLAPDTNQSLSEGIYSAVNKLPSDIYVQTTNRKKVEKSYTNDVIPADSSVKNYTYTVREGRLYMREDSSLLPQSHLSGKVQTCIMKLCAIRNIVHELIDMQIEGCTKEELEECQSRLNQLYDVYVAEYGYFNDKYTKRVFCDDVEYPLLCALEEKVEDKYVKAKIFSQQTILPNNAIEKVENAIEALNITVANYGYVNMENILRIYSHELKDVIEELHGEIYLNPEKCMDENPLIGFETREEYLSGDVRKKLAVALLKAENNERFKENVTALESVIPKDIDATEIEVKLGVSWISVEDYQKFIYERFKIPFYMEKYVYIEYNSLLHSYFIQGKSSVNTVEIKKTYGTESMNGLEILENLLNQRQLKVMDKVEKPDGKVSYVLNQNATTLVKEKGEQIRENFSEWLFSDVERREKYVRLYNDRFNNICLREYDGSYLTFPGMNQNFSLRPHQKNAVARIIRGGNTLLDHCVGGGKSFIMASAAMEMKRLGLANKVMLVVPNHLTGQIAGEFLKLYPAANILLTTKKDFEKNNRKRFVSKIATGEYDGVIIGFSQFEKIPVSKERQQMVIQKELDEVTEFIHSMKREKNQSWSIKQMQSHKKKLRRKLELLANEEYKDDVITFEELGVDALMVDEAHYFKNLSFTTKMGNVSGINPNGSLRAYDMHLKCNYINEISPGRNVVFSTATPISNSICEMYQMQKYLQGDLLRERGLYHFDAWAANFGEAVSSMELSPEGKGYREKTRFSKFTNIPELVTTFRMIADIKTQNMLSYLDIPSLVNDSYDVCQCEANEDIEECINEFVERAAEIRAGKVDPAKDNMLKVCHDAKLLSTDIRLLYPNADPYTGGKLFRVVENVFRIYNETMEEKGAQIIFSDIGVPNGGKGFNVYQFIKDELVNKGIPAEEICFIHDAKNEKQREDMFQDIRNGIRRVIIGSTEKMGTGTNIQTRLYAMHEIDVPWRPSDVEQREGRILRQGNMYKEVHIFRYVTKKTFDAYNWSIIENKQKFISQILNGDIVERKCTDIDEAVLNFAEMKAIASGNPLIKEKIEVDAEVSRLSLLKKSFTMGKYRLEKEMKHILPERKENCEGCIQKVKADIVKRNESELYKEAVFNDNNGESGSFSIFFNGKRFAERKLAGEYLSIILKSLPSDGKSRVVGNYAGFDIAVCRSQIFSTLEIIICGEMKYSFEVSEESSLGNILKIQNAVRGFEKNLNDYEKKLEEINQAFLATKKEYEKTFAKENELVACLQRQEELNELLTVDEDKKEKEKTVNHNKNRKVI